MVRKSRLNPANEEIKQDYRYYLKYQRDFKLNNDSIKDKMSKIDKYDEFLSNENRYANLKKVNPEGAKELLDKQKEWAKNRYEYYSKL